MKEKIIYFKVKGGGIPFLSSIRLLNHRYGSPDDGVQSEPKHVAVNKTDKACVMCE